MHYACTSCYFYLRNEFHAIHCDYSSYLPLKVNILLQIFFLFHFHFCRKGSSRYVEVLIFFLADVIVRYLFFSLQKAAFQVKAFGGEMPSFIQCQMASTFTKHCLTNFYLVKVNKYSICLIFFFSASFISVFFFSHIISYLSQKSVNAIILTSFAP